MWNKIKFTTINEAHRCKQRIILTWTDGDFVIDEFSF